ncbi:MAG: lysophospholipid acyltransferase family protein [Anaeromyxobacter sp.]
MEPRALRLPRVAARVSRIVRLAWAVGARGRRASGSGPSAERAEIIGSSSAEALATLGIEVEADGPRPPPGALLCANHLSYLDPIVVASVARCVPISKAELADWPVFGPVARATGVLFITRGNTASGLEVMRHAQALLEGGLSVLNFPEGTTTRGDGVLPFRPGLFGTARRAGAPVVPISIAYDPPGLAWTGAATFLPHFLALAARPRSAVRVRFGAPVPARLYPDSASLADAVRGRLLELRGGAPWRKIQP